MEKLMDQPFVGLSRPSNTFAFAFKSRGQKPDLFGTDWMRGIPSVAYDAENKKIEIALPIATAMDENSNYLWASVWSYRSTQVGTYIASNAYGTKKLVKKFVDVQDELIVDDSF